MIEIRSLSLAYSRKTPLVLQNVDFSLGKGEIGVLLGPNGAGKSTLLKSIVGLLRPKEGTIAINEKPLSEYKAGERAKLVAYVPQVLSYSPATVFDTVMLGRLPHFGLFPGPNDEAAVKKVLSDIGIEHLTYRNLHELSGGERQKVAIARALAQESDIIVFDEPTANLDISSETLIAESVRTLSREYGKTIVLALHDLNLAYRLGDRFLFLKQGSVVSSGGKEAFVEGTIEATFGVSAKKIDTEEGTIFLMKGNKP